MSAARKVPWSAVPLHYSPTEKTVGEEKGGGKLARRLTDWLTVSLIYWRNDGLVVKLIDLTCWLIGYVADWLSDCLRLLLICWGFFTRWLSNGRAGVEWRRGEREKRGREKERARGDGELDEKQGLLTVFKLYRMAWNEFPRSKGQEMY